MNSLRSYVNRARILPAEICNYLFFILARILATKSNYTKTASAAIMHLDHPVLTPFFIRLKYRLQMDVDFVYPNGDFSGYDRVIVPNGYWPSVKPFCDAIPLEKKLFCEIGFLPQANNVYFDPEGVHGRSSIRNIPLPELTPEQQRQLAYFKTQYLKDDYIRLKWASVQNKEQASHTWAEELGDFIFVPLQLETDTAFQLCPFQSNQELISFIEHTLDTRTIVFKMHPLDKNPPYHCTHRNIVLPPSNTALRQLLTSSDSVVAANSTVILEALLLEKRCATLGIGLTTNHTITFECHDDVNRLKQFDKFTFQKERTDRFLYQIINRQVGTDYHKNTTEKDKLLRIMADHGITSRS